MGATDGPQKGVPHSVMMVVLPFGQVIRRHWEMWGASVCRPIGSCRTLGSSRTAGGFLFPCWGWLLAGCGMSGETSVLFAIRLLGVSPSWSVCGGVLSAVPWV